MPGGSAYKQGRKHLHLTKTAQYKYMNITKQQKTENTEENKMNILPGNEPGPSSL
jgi:hypothetical protein